MGAAVKKSYLWWLLYLISEILLIYILQYKVSEKILWLGIPGILYIYINVLFCKYKREALFVNGLIFYVSVVLTGTLLGSLLRPWMILISGLTTSVTDVLSFTKYGQNTANAKAMANPNYLYRLMVYGRGVGDRLYPTCGIGDYLYFAMWISGLAGNMKMLFLLGMALLTGNLMNMAVAHFLRARPDYRGIPGLPLPFLCIFSVYCIAKVHFGL